MGIEISPRSGTALLTAPFSNGQALNADGTNNA